MALRLRVKLYDTPHSHHHPSLPHLRSALSLLGRQQADALPSVHQGTLSSGPGRRAQTEGNVSQYIRGRRWEHEVKSRLEASGWLVCRCASSKPFDLIAFRPGRLPMWVECKIGSCPSRGITRGLQSLATANGARYIVVVKKNPSEERRR